MKYFYFTKIEPVHMNLSYFENEGKNMKSVFYWRYSKITSNKFKKNKKTVSF